MAFLGRVVPQGLLEYLNSVDPVPEQEVDRIHNRDNLQLAVVSHVGFLKTKTIT